MVVEAGEPRGGNHDVDAQLGEISSDHVEPEYIVKLCFSGFWHPLSRRGAEQRDGDGAAVKDVGDVGEGQQGFGRGEVPEAVESPRRRCAQGGYRVGTVGEEVRWRRRSEGGVMALEQDAGPFR